MKEKLIALLLAAAMMLSLLAGCGGKDAASDGAAADPNATYTYHGTYSSVSTWSPTD